MLAPAPGEIGGRLHARLRRACARILERMQPGGRAARSRRRSARAARRRKRGCARRASARTSFVVARTNFAGCRRRWLREGLDGADCHACRPRRVVDAARRPCARVLVQDAGPLDMRMNPQRGPAGVGVAARDRGRRSSRRCSRTRRRAARRGARRALAGRPSTGRPRWPNDPRARPDRTRTTASVRRVFQALRIAVNDEFAVLDTLLRQLPRACTPAAAWRSSPFTPARTAG